MNKRINVTKSYLPPFKEYTDKLKTIWDNHFLTNFGPLNNELVNRLEKYLGVKNLHYVNNGTSALQLALETLEIEDGEVITTPFTFIATSNSIVWQRCKPVFVDIDPNDYNIDVTKIENKITKNTKAIMAVHCFGYPCNVAKIKAIADKYNLKVIYDAAHSFGTKLNNKSIFSYGDISCSSLQATKVYHTVEGGLCIVNNEKYNARMNALKNFGTEDGIYQYFGINAKDSEFHAAMGLCVLDHIDEIIEKRHERYDWYVKYLENSVVIPKMPDNFTYNYIYFPVLFKSEENLLEAFDQLNKINIFPRRYFYPSINDLKLYNEYNHDTPIASDISRRIACLPFDTYITETTIKKIAKIVKKANK